MPLRCHCRGVYHTEPAGRCRRGIGRTQSHGERNRLGQPKLLGCSGASYYDMLSDSRAWPCWAPSLKGRE
jgi:hypothetical protein